MTGTTFRFPANVYSVVKALFRGARIDDLVVSDPCILTARQLGKLRDKDLGWRAEAVFTRGELLTLLTDPRIPDDRRMLYGLMGVGMMRTGEACGLRWRHVDLKATPLGRLTIVNSYDHDTTKTEAERWMPVNLALAVLFDAWKALWPEHFGRAQTPDDLVLPCPMPTNRGPRKEYGSRSTSTSVGWST